MTSSPELTEPTSPGHSATPADSEPRDYGVLKWLVLATFIVILNETVMLNAVPRLMTEFEVGPRSAQWLTSAFMLTMAVVIPVTGWFLRRVTTRQAFTLAMSVFCLGTLVCAIAPTFAVLLLGRVVQAAGTAVMMPLLMTTLMTIVAERDRGRVMGNVTLAISVAPALGPAMSGVILDVGSWRLIFGAVLPLAIAVTVVGLKRLANVGETVRGQVDWTSALLAAFGFGPLVYGLSQLGGDPNPAWLPYAALAVGACSLVAFVLRQLKLQRDGVPLLDLRTLKSRPFVLGLALLSVAFMAMLGSMILLPLYLQDVRFLSERDSGLLVMPGGILMGVLGPQVGKVFDTYGGRVLVIPGSIGVLVALFGFSRVQVDTSQWYVLAVHMVLMASLAAVFTPIFTISLGSLTPELYSHGSSMLSTLQQVAAAAGTAVVVAVMAARESHLLADGVTELSALVGGMQAGFGVGAICAIAVVVLAFLVPARAPESAGAAHPGGH